MTLSRLQIEKARPLSSSRLKTPRTVKTQGRNTPRAETFKNPLLGIEANLMQKLEEVNEEYYDTSYKKRTVLLDALEDIANSKTGYKQLILNVLETWKPPPVHTESDRTSALTELMRTQKEYRKVAESHQHQDETIQDLKDQIEKAIHETEDYQSQIQEMKEKLKTTDYFALSRKLTTSLKDLQDSFNQIFNIPKRTEENPEIAQLIQESASLKRERTKLLYELNICLQVTKRLELNEITPLD